MGQQSVTKSAQKTMGHKKSSSVAEVAGPHHEVFANVAQTLRLCLKLCVTWITFRIRTTTLFGWLRSFGDTANASLFTWRVECELLHGLAKRIHEWSCVAARGLCFSGLNSQQDWFSEKGVYLCWGCAATHASEECWWGVSVFNYERWHRCPQKRQHQQGWQQHDSSVPLSFSRAVQKKNQGFGLVCQLVGWWEHDPILHSADPGSKWIQTQKEMCFFLCSLFKPKHSSDRQLAVEPALPVSKLYILQSRFNVSCRIHFVWFVLLMHNQEDTFCASLAAYWKAAPKVIGNTDAQYCCCFLFSLDKHTWTKLDKYLAWLFLARISPE